MTTNIAVALLGTLVFAGLIQGVAVALFLRLIGRGYRLPPNILQRFPKAGVVLSLRGRDAFLRECLQGLLDQDYPDYTVQIVVDSVNDPAWHAVAQVVEELSAKHVQVAPLKVRRPTCSLKCSSLIQAVSELDDAREVLAFIDADVIPHRTWLRELVAPLADERIGATTGMRWYMPGTRLAGSVVRCAWSVAAIVQMYIFDVAWGGTLAVRTSTLREGKLVEQWARSFNDDILVGHMVSKAGLRLQFVPSLIMVNREECRLVDFRAFVTRQLLHTRFYHRRWPELGGASLFLTLLLPTACLFALGSLLAGDGVAAGLAAIGLVAYFVILTILYPLLERSLRREVLRRGEATQRMGFRRLWAVSLAQLVHCVGFVPALFRRTVCWRGVTYRINDKWNVEMLDDDPYVAAKSSTDVTVSV